MPTHKLGFVGAKFRPSGLQLVQQLQNRHPVLLVREPTNTHDPNAVAVYVPIGYIPAAQAKQWADQIDTIQPRGCVAATLVGYSSIELITPAPHPFILGHEKSDDDIPF